jgi:predicted DNA-binding transcriptional regulator AlpA
MASTASPTASFLREKQVRKLIPVAHSTLWAWVRSGRFPAPLKLSARITVWRDSDVLAFIKRYGGEA